MSGLGFSKLELSFEKKKTLDTNENNFSIFGGNKNKNMEKELEKVTYIFEIFIEKEYNEKEILGNLNKIKLNLALISKKYTEYNLFFEKNKNKIEEYIKFNNEIKLKLDLELNKYYESLEKERLLFYIEYERKLREYKELELYYHELIKGFNAWCSSVEKLKSLFQTLEIENMVNHEILNKSLNNNIGDGLQKTTLHFDETVTMQYLFDKLRINGDNKGIQMFSSLNKSIFSLFDNIDGEELLDPLINIIYSMSDETSDDNFISIFKSFIEGNIKKDIDIFGLNDNGERNYLKLRDELMGFKTVVFFKKESYLYLFEINKKMYYIKYRSDIGLLNQGQIDKFQSDNDIEGFFTNYLKIN